MESYFRGGGAIPMMGDSFGLDDGFKHSPESLSLLASRNGPRGRQTLHNAPAVFVESSMSFLGREATSSLTGSQQGFLVAFDCEQALRANGAH